MKILHVTSSVNPAQGGLSACIRALVPALAELGCFSEIACLDAPDESHLQSIPCPVHAFGPGRGVYGYAAGMLPWLKAERSRFDAVIVHGLWQYHGLAAYRALAEKGGPPYFIFSHGMLDPWFKREYPLKHLKKTFYWWLAERRILRRAEAVLFTCEEERRLARKSFPGSSYRERVVTFGTTAPPENSEEQCAAFFARWPQLRNQRYWLFLGRIHPKKGVDLLLNAYARLAAGAGGLPRLVMAGPCADESYLRRLQASCAQIPAAQSVLWPGMLSGDVKWGALRAAEAFVLPSHQENFGIAVVEALACQTPVLISTQVNIWQEIVSDGAGLAEADTAEGTQRLLERWTALDVGAVSAMRTAARRSFLQRFEITAVARSLFAALNERRQSA